MNEKKQTSGHYAWGEKDNPIKRRWHAFKYWWAFENGDKICCALIVGGLIGTIGGAAIMANCEYRMSDAERNEVVNKAVAATIETMHLMGDISEMVAEGGENK